MTLAAREGDGTNDRAVLVLLFLRNCRAGRVAQLIRRIVYARFFQNTWTYCIMADRMLLITVKAASAKSMVARFSLAAGREHTG